MKPVQYLNSFRPQQQGPDDSDIKVYKKSYRAERIYSIQLHYQSVENTSQIIRIRRNSTARAYSKMHLSSMLLAIVTLLGSAQAIPASPATSSAAPIPTPPGKAYAPGWCTFHLDVWIPDNGEWLAGHKPYQAQITYLLDANHNKIGAMANLESVSGVSYTMDSALPYGIVIASNHLDQEHHDGVITFAYADSFWNISSPQCSGWGGNSGNGFGSAINQADCGFTCD